MTFLAAILCCLVSRYCPKLALLMLLLDLVISMTLVKW